MVTILNRSGTKIYKFSDIDKKDMKISFRYAVQQGSYIKGFKTLDQLNRALKTTRKELSIKPSSFRR